MVTEWASLPRRSTCPLWVAGGPKHCCKSQEAVSAAPAVDGLDFGIVSGFY
jgi:hypothetical protein